MSFAAVGESATACRKPDGPKVCAPCEGGEASGLKVYTQQELEQELVALPLWKPSAEGDFIVRSFVAKNFLAAMAFLNGVGEVAEEQGHHPDMHLTQYRNVEIRLQTHSMGGVTLNDIAEAKLLDQVPISYSPMWLRKNPEALTAAATSASASPSPQASSS